MNLLNRKLRRDLLQMKGQSLAIAVLIALAVGTFVGSASTYRSLMRSRDTYYAEYRFGNVFDEAARAPRLLEEKFRALPGVEDVQLRLATQGLITLPGFDEPVTARIVGLPMQGQPNLGRIHIRKGRLPEPGESDEAVVSEALATAQHLEPGDTLSILANGRYRKLRISGIGLSPEHIYEVKPGDMFPDNMRYGILWVRESVLEEALGMKGAFNEVVLLLSRGASESDAIAATDRLLKPYGGLGAYGRDRHVSARFISEELKQLKTMAFFIPSIFMAVAVFLLNIIVARTVSIQREQIATLKALGYGNWTVAMHYLTMVSVVVLIGSAAGGLIGYGYGVSMTKMYAAYYRFARFIYLFSAREMAVGAALALFAATVGTLSAVRRAVKLRPAEAMRPAAPPLYRRSLFERLGFTALLSMPGRMVFRNLGRRPLRALASVVGISFSAALLVTGLFFNDAMGVIIDSQFRRAERQDLSVTFSRPVALGALQELMRLPGVYSVEPRRAVSAILRKGHRSYRAAVQGIPPHASLQRILADNGDVLEVPAHGLMLSGTLAHNIDAKVGDRIEVELLEGPRDIRFATVTALADEPFGTSAYASIDTARALAGGDLDITSVLLSIDSAAEKAIYKQLSVMPTVAAVTSRMAMLKSFDKMTTEVMLVFAGILALFAGAMAMGVVYNAARISLSERERELATMRVIGMTRAEISGVLLGELLVLVLVSLPIGCLLGYGLAAATAVSSSTEMYRVPLIVLPKTFIFAMVVVVVSSLIVSLTVRRRLDKLDLISVLKTKE